MSQEYIKLFEDLIERLFRIAKKKELEKDLNEIMNDIISDMNILWNLYKRYNFIISEEEKREFTWKIRKHQYNLNILVEKYGILKSCSKCKEILPITTENFYIDRNRKNGLTIYCKKCIKNSKNNKNNHENEKSY